MFGKAEIENSSVSKSRNREIQCLEQPKQKIQMFGKPKIEITMFGEEPKSRIPMFGKAKIENSNVWKSQNRVLQSLEKPKQKIPVFRKADIEREQNIGPGCKAPGCK